MALTTSFGFTNSTVSSTKNETLYNMGEVTNYGLKSDEPTECVLLNKTTPTDAPEIVAYFCKDTNNVQTSLKNRYPDPVKGGVSYGVRVEAMLSTTDSEDPKYRVDHPVVCTISFRHALYGEITADLVHQLLGRAESALITESGTSRINDLMRSTLRPTVE